MTNSKKMAKPTKEKNNQAATFSSDLMGAVSTNLRKLESRVLPAPFIEGEDPDIDMDFLNLMTRDDKEFKKELLTLFLENIDDNIIKIEDTLKAGDKEGWYKAVHQLNGSAGVIGAFNLSKILEYAKTHVDDDYEQKLEIVELINIWCERLKIAVKKLL